MYVMLECQGKEKEAVDLLCTGGMKSLRNVVNCDGYLKDAEMDRKLKTFKQLLRANEKNYARL